MGIRIEGLPSQYNSYKVDIEKVNSRIEKQKDGRNNHDRAEISAEGKKALESRMSALTEQKRVDDIRHLSVLRII